MAKKKKVEKIVSTKPEAHIPNSAILIKMGWHGAKVVIKKLKNDQTCNKEKLEKIEREVRNHFGF